ncbi:hypothetical protein DLAC_07402 [Tieghemostelium lacteum]|uniref:Uncharacterized protein n=1 Tax=Tieghemostelium lacteum TaxID=361077 RepID=A0A151ZCG3_TIELA|nr:hypothetical protein DLAC_07402 [Tieghemostelium lacteum]|eukprot:KYQ91630.1 hypothetical protein DLAC_07402 [Tieghemostelium lacteum]
MVFSHSNSNFNIAPLTSEIHDKEDVCYLNIIICNNAQIGNSIQKIKFLLIDVINKQLSPFEQVFTQIGICSIVLKFDDSQDSFDDAIRTKIKKSTSNKCEMERICEEMAQELELKKKRDDSANSLSILLIIGNGVIEDDPCDGIFGLIGNNGKAYGLVYNKPDDETLENLENLIPTSPIYDMTKSENVLEFTESIQSLSKTDGINIAVEFRHHEQKIQSMRDDLYLDVEVKSTNNYEKVKAGTKIEILKTGCYGCYTSFIKEDVEPGSSYTETFKLVSVKTSVANDIPNRLKFRIETGGKTYVGYVKLNIAYFIKDLVSTHEIKINVVGDIGNGKSTILNGFYNLFSPFSELLSPFIASNGHGHCTSKVEFQSIQAMVNRSLGKHPLFDSMKDIKMVLCDKWGMTDIDGPLKNLYEGKIYHGTTKDNNIIQAPNKQFAVNMFIFVVSIKTFQVAEKIKKINDKIQEVIQFGVMPLVAITFTDDYKTQPEMIRQLRSSNPLALPDNHIFTVQNYTQFDTYKSIEKDLSLYKILKSAVSLTNTRLDNPESISTQPSSSSYNPYQSPHQQQIINRPYEPPTQYYSSPSPVVGNNSYSVSYHSTPIKSEESTPPTPKTPLMNNTDIFSSNNNLFSSDAVIGSNESISKTISTALSNESDRNLVIVFGEDQVEYHCKGTTLLSDIKDRILSEEPFGETFVLANYNICKESGTIISDTTPIYIVAKEFETKLIIKQKKVFSSPSTLTF